MTAEVAGILADTLDAAQSVYSDFPTIKTGESAFSATETKGLYECSLGFSYEYGKPASDGGKYITLTDLRMMYYIGVEAGKGFISGCKPYWDSHIATAYVGNKIDGYLRGYPTGAIIRHSSGKKMVHRNSSTVAMPTDYESTDVWGTVIAKQCIGRYRNLSSQYGGSGTYDYFGIPINFTLPYAPVTKVYMTSYEVPYSGLYDFDFSYNYCYGKDNAYRLDARLCDEGELELRASRYDDIYTNEGHSESYISIGTTGLRWLYGTNRKYNSSRYIKSITGLIPLQKGTWYFYLDYRNGCAEQREMTSGRWILGPMINARVFCPELKWPTY